MRELVIHCNQDIAEEISDFIDVSGGAIGIR